MRLACWLIFCLLSLSSVAQELQPIGSWREHLPFNNALQVAVGGNLIYCATPYGFFTYDKADASFERRTKINGLNEVKVRLMLKEPQGDRVVLVYENTNIDFLDGNKVINLPDIWLSAAGGDRTGLAGPFDAHGQRPKLRHRTCRPGHHLLAVRSGDRPGF